MKTAKRMLLSGSVILAAATALPAQNVFPQRRLEIEWSKVYDYPEIVGIMRRIQSTWPEYVQVHEIGESFQGRTMYVLAVHDRKTGDERLKPAMWVDANVHGNEVQGSEAALYAAWYLLENADRTERAQELLARTVLYVCPSVNPDGRAYWFQNANTSSSSRSGQKPVDDDGDGLFDEDPPNDLDGDGHLTRMRKYVPGEGRYRLDPEDPRELVRVKPGEKGDYEMLGMEGIDDDGDGRINEDGPGGYDLNRNWGSGWQPNHVQYGAGDYPFSHPESRNVARFILQHPNIAAVQSFHNSGGMILRGPGAEERESFYPRSDQQAYDAMATEGERMLPFYRNMVIHRDLYTVHGGFVNWTAEGLGIFSFTNEMWSRSRLFPQTERRPEENESHWFDDHLLLGSSFSPWKEVDHPTYGKIEVGGFHKTWGRMPPHFLIEEECHRNALFVLYHAYQMPKLRLEDVRVDAGPSDLRYVTATVFNERLIPTRSALAANRELGLPDLFRIEGENLEVIGGGFPRDLWDLAEIELVDHDPANLRIERGVGGRDEVTVRWIVRGSGEITITYEAEKGGRFTRSAEL